MRTRALGNNGPVVSELGLGCMGMSGVYGATSDAEGIAAVHAAVDAGITLLDTGDFYGMGHNEMLVGRAIAGKRDKLFISVKFGALRAPDGAWIGFDTSPAHVKTALAYTLKRLGTDYVDLYQPARLDPKTPIEETVGAIAELKKQGYVRHIGLSEMGVATIERAHKVHPIAALQIEYSLMSRGVEKDILPALRRLGIGMTAYGVLSRGLIGGSVDGKSALAKDDFRAHSPRFVGDNLAQNLKLVAALREVGRELDATPAQLAIAWALARGEDVVPLVGARTPEHVRTAVAAAALRLLPEQLARIEAAVPHEAVAGTRYAAQQMAMLDSEKR
jgi:aryl-alcohol dehydrogenase-like predicted oxidoreductase